jgi:ABC-type thiamine transport system substrate-binding protein
MKPSMFLLSLVLILPGGAHAGSAWQEEWERTLGAAKKEGKVTVIADVTADIRDSLTTAFQGKYGIPVEYFGVMGREISPRVSTERNAGRYTWDVYVHGTTTGLTAMVPMAAFDPLEPALIFPDVKDPKNWRGGGLEFVDPGRQLLATSVRQRGIIFVNPNLVNPREFKSYKDLLHPKWRGKIAMDDPTRAGPGQATFTFFYIHPSSAPISSARWRNNRSWCSGIMGKRWTRWARVVFRPSSAQRISSRLPESDREFQW